MLEKAMKQNDFTACETRNLFDQTLRQRIEGLVGTSVGLGTLPLNCANISCLILLTERENEIENFDLDPSERYTQKTFLDELAEMGLGSDADLKKALQEIIQKGYTLVDADGRFFPEKPTTSAAHLLDRIFPGMSGMNLVAYLIQTMDEVQSGRKDLDFAITQLDQTLQMKGVPLKKEKARPGPRKVLKPPVKRVTSLKKIRLPRISHSESKILSSSDHSAQKEIKAVRFGEVFSKQDKSPESCPEILEKNKAQKPDMGGVEKRGAPGDQNETEAICVEPKIFSGNLQEMLSRPGAETVDLAGEEDLVLTEDEDKKEDLSKHSETESEQIKSVQPEEALPPSEKEYGTKSIPEEHVPDNADYIIEKRIAAFEEDLSMQCPICKSGKIQAIETAMGKLYYNCSNKSCNFISWGKPYHLVCPQCNNPFLIETIDRDGKKIIKCPRATCRYRQKSPLEIADEQREKAGSTSKEPANKTMNLRKPLRKVVRRRVVRRKR
jgi:ssDNA-binding Zn-finger/Zn-ribbon topoisomerase 1